MDPVRLEQRAEPRVTIAVAAAGCALAVTGTLLISGDGLDGDGGGSQVPGVLLSLAVTVAGFVLLARQRSGPLATAGSVASTLGVPPLVFFVTFDEGAFPPYSTEAILFLSTAVWAVAWAAGPGRGRPLYLGAAAIGLWTLVLQLTEEVFTSPFAFFVPVSFDETGDLGFDRDIPDPMTIGVLSIAFGAGYLLAARAMDRRGKAGGATPLTAAGIVCLAVGIPFLADELEAAGAGFVALVAGTLVAVHGASVGRRATTWLGAAGAAQGIVAIVGDAVEEPTPAGAVLIAFGAAGILLAEWWRRATGEPDELPGKESVNPPHWVAE
jgi:hypothetical protein